MNKLARRPNVWPLFLGVAFLLPLSGTAYATTFTVTKTQDTYDGTCDADCSLRDAISHANFVVGADVIQLPAGTYTLALAGIYEDDNSTGDLDITEDLEIQGAGADVTIVDGAGIDRVFHLVGGSSASISGLTIQGGVAVTVLSDWGGGIRTNSGTSLTLTDCSVSGNTARAGGGIHVSGDLSVIRSILSQNIATLYAGGGIYVSFWGGSIAIENSTISRNQAAGDGGGIFRSAGTLNLVHVTLSENSAGGDGSAVYGHANFINSIIHGSCERTGTSGGGNLESPGNTCDLQPVADLFSLADPMLAALANNGGPTNTYALLTGSPAIDFAGNASCPTEDQRGFLRRDGSCDSGAFEFGALSPTIFVDGFESGGTSAWSSAVP